MCCNSHSLCFPCALNQTIAALCTPRGAGEIPHFLLLFSVLKKELENLIQCRRLLKPRASKATAQELQFCKELKVNPWSKGGVTCEFVLENLRESDFTPSEGVSSCNLYCGKGFGVSASLIFAGKWMRSTLG